MPADSNKSSESMTKHWRNCARARCCSIASEPSAAFAGSSRSCSIAYSQPSMSSLPVWIASGGMRYSSMQHV